MGMHKIIIAVLLFLFLVLSVMEAGAIDRSIRAPGANVGRYPNGLLKSCIPKDPIALSDIKCNSGSPISFYDNNRIETGVLVDGSTISGQKCKALELISFYPDGTFRSGVRRD